MTQAVRQSIRNVSIVVAFAVMVSLVLGVAMLGFVVMAGLAVVASLAHGLFSGRAFSRHEMVLQPVRVHADHRSPLQRQLRR